MEYTCRCNNFSVEWDTQIKNPIARQCSCEYCRNSKAEFLSDPESKVFYKIRNKNEYKIIKHGHGTAEFHECRNCGVIIVTSKINGELYCVINAKALCVEGYTLDPSLKDYGDETIQGRLARREKNWCKAGKC